MKAVLGWLAGDERRPPSLTDYLVTAGAVHLLLGPLFASAALMALSLRNPRQRALLGRVPGLLPAAVVTAGGFTGYAVAYAVVRFEAWRFLPWHLLWVTGIVWGLVLLGQRVGARHGLGSELT